MGKRLNREQVLFLVGTVLFVWVMFRLALFLTQRPAAFGRPKARAGEILPGDPDMRQQLSIPPLETYLDGRRNPFRSGGGSGRSFVRSTVYHEIRRAGIRSRYAFEFRMVPSPVDEIRLLLPPGTQVENEEVGGRERDWNRKCGQDGRILCVPVKPVPIKRSYYGAQIALAIRSQPETPGMWIAPVVACTGPMKNAECEFGDLALLTPGDEVNIILATTATRGLNPLMGDAIPKRLASNYTKHAFHFTQPDYQLAMRLEPKKTATTVVIGPKPPDVRPKPPDVRPKPPDVRPKPPDVRPKPPDGNGGDDNKITIPAPPGAEDLRYKVVGIVGVEEPDELRRQVVLRDSESEAYIRKSKGDTLPDGAKIASITDNAVIIIDAKGRTHVLRGRFTEFYGN